MLRISITLLLCCISLVARADYHMQYTVSFDTVGHYANVQLDYTTDTALTDPVTLTMPVWAPGYYMIVDFPKYLTDFEVKGDSNVAASWQKQGKNHWQITAPGAKSLQVCYRIYANERSVVECRVEPELAFLPTNGLFMYQENDVLHPADIRFEMPGNWSSISTGLRSTGRNTFHSNDFDELYDSPFLLGNQRVIRFSHEGHPYEFALETPAGFDSCALLPDFKKMVSAVTRMMGDVPYDNYCLIHLGQGGGGLEHRNSQACYTEGTYRFPSRAEYINFMGFVTHEYFHLYNVKDIRPIELGPFDYNREVFTPLIWVSEGFTVYYETQLMLRAGIIQPDELLSELSTYFQNIETHDGPKHMSLRQSSYDIWLNFMYYKPNWRDTKISYYVKGPVVGLVFDAEIRSHSAGKKSLDDLMRNLYYKYYKQLGRGFTEEEFWNELTIVLDNDTELCQKIRTLVDTTTPIDYDNILALVGLQIDHNTWQLSRQSKPAKQALQRRNEMLGE